MAPIIVHRIGDSFGIFWFLKLHTAHQLQSVFGTEGLNIAIGICMDILTARSSAVLTVYNFVMSTVTLSWCLYWHLILEVMYRCGPQRN